MEKLSEIKYIKAFYEQINIRTCTWKSFLYAFHVDTLTLHFQGPFPKPEFSQFFHPDLFTVPHLKCLPQSVVYHHHC